MGGWWGTLSSLLGVVTVVIMIASRFARRRTSRRGAVSLVEVARELGLEHAPSRFSSGQGSLRGRYQGLAVRVDPDEEQKIGVRFETQPRIELRNYAITAPVPFDMEEVHAPDDAFNRFWMVRRASPAIADQVFEQASAEWIEPFMLGKYARNVKSLTVTADGITCEVNFGSPHIPPDAVKALLKACVSLAARLEPNAEVPLERLVAEARAANRPDDRESGRATALQSFIERRFGLVLAGTATLAAAVELWWCATTYGTNDVYALERFATWARFLGSDIYVQDATMGHPPLLLPIVVALEGLASATGWDFSFWLRAASSLASAATLLLVYRIAAPRLDQWRTRWGLLLLAASPVLLLVYGFHGSTDALMIALLMLSVFWTEQGGSDALAGTALGLAAGVHPAALLCLPVLVGCRTGSKRRLTFAAAAAGVAVLCFATLASPHLKPAIARVFASSAPYGHWGLSWLVTEAFGPDALPGRALREGGTYWLLLVVGGLSLALHTGAGRASAYERVGILVSVGLACSSTFGVQHLAWLAPWLVGLPLLPVLFYTLTSAGFLLVVYTYWSRGLPWFLADSNRIGDYRGHADYFHLVCWASVLVLIAYQWRRSRADNHAFDGPLDSMFKRPGVALAAAALLLLPSVVQVRELMTGGRNDDAKQSLAAIRAKQHIELSAILIGRGRYDDGIEVARRATAFDPTQPVAWNNLAAGHSSKSEWDAAIEAAERAVRLDPGFQLAKNNLVWAREQKARARNAGSSSLVRPL